MKNLQSVSSSTIVGVGGIVDIYICTDNQICRKTIFSKKLHRTYMKHTVLIMNGASMEQTVLTH